MKVTYSDDMTPDDIEETANRLEGALVAAERDRAVLARIGGNLYRERLVNGTFKTGYYGTPMADLDRYVASDAASLLKGESYLVGHYSQPYHSESGEWDSPAVFHGTSHFMSKRPSSVARLPESAFDWPVYRAAIIGCTSDDPTNHQGATCPVHEA